MFKDKQDSFVIAEVGQNHQGDLAIARDFIRIFAFEGADAIKFQTRSNTHLFSPEAYAALYPSENAFAATYGEHREKLELKPEWLPVLKEDCRKNGIRMGSTPFDEPSLDLLIQHDVDFIKLASFDLGNLPFAHRIAKAGKPVVMSVGGGQMDQIAATVEIFLKAGVEVSILHCVSEYPCEFHRLGLDSIETLARKFPHCVLGLSDHFNGTLSGPVAYLKGARVFEKHVTLNRAWKGTDHSFALEPEGFRRFVRDIKRVRHMLPPKAAEEVGKEAVFQKLGKSVVAYRDIAKGEVLSLENLSGRIFNEQYIPVRETARLLNRKAVRNIAKGELIRNGDFEGPS